MSRTRVTGMFLEVRRRKVSGELQRAWERSSYPEEQRRVLLIDRG